MTHDFIFNSQFHVFVFVVEEGKRTINDAEQQTSYLPNASSRNESMNQFFPPTHTDATDHVND